MSDACTTCGKTRPKWAHWFHINQISASGKLVTVAVYCRSCVPAGHYAERLVSRRVRRMP
jgi:hypothetical protein